VRCQVGLSSTGPAAQATAAFKQPARNHRRRSEWEGFSSVERSVSLIIGKRHDEVFDVISIRKDPVVLCTPPAI
jgi:hypothetical protein